MADMMSTLKGILGDGADEKIKNAMSILSQAESGEETQNADAKANSIPENSPILTSEGVEMIAQLKGMFDRISNTNDSRSELLRSLRPFVRSERQRSIDRAIKLINIGRFSGLIGK